jgi:hypothetical protein
MRNRIVLMVALVLAAAGLAQAQETTSGSIGGNVVDVQGAAIPGATVTVTSNQGSRSVVTDGEGRFFLPFLVPGKYSIKVELAGFTSYEQTGIDVRLGQRLELKGIALKVGQITETVQVVGESPVIDVTSTTAGGVLSGDMLKNLPVGRSLADLLYVVPGVSAGGGSPIGGNATPSIAGGSALENNYIVDGVNITDVGFGAIGNFNPAYGSLGAGVTSDFIKETQVKTAGFEAEYGQSTGGVVNVVTKSGGNQFSGSVYGYMSPDALQSSWKQLSTPDGTTNSAGAQNSDVGVSLGGPVVKDKVFFFGTFNPQFQRRTFTAPAGFPYASLGPVDRNRKIYAYAGKVTLQATSNHRFDVSVFGDPSKGESGLQRTATLKRYAYPGDPGTTDIAGGYSSLDYGGHNQTIRYDGILSPRWFVEASFAHAQNKFNESPTTNDWQYTDTRYVPLGTTGGLGYYENTDGRNNQLSLKSTNIFNAAGSHQLRYGIQYENIQFTRDTEYTGPNLLLADGQTTVTGGPVQIRTGGGVTYYRATRGKLRATAPTTQKYLNWFAQDTWQIGRLTLRPGIRWERQMLQGTEPTAELPALCFVGDSRPGAGDGSGAGIACSYTWTNLWSPRIGATYDIFGNGRSKIYASWGRFFAKIPNDLASRSMSADPGITRQNYRDAALTQPVANGTSFAGTTTQLIQSSGSASIIDPNATSTYLDEFTGGVEFEVAPMLSLGVRYIHRNLKSLIEDIGQLAVVGYFLDVCGDTTVDYFITNVNATTPTVSCGGAVPSAFEDPAHKYDAFEVTLNKNFSNKWGIIASYRYSKLKGNFEGFYRSDNGQTDPAISSLFDFPTNDATYTEIGVPEFGFSGDIRYQGTTLGQGVLPNDRPHQVKVYGNYTFSDVNLGLAFNWGSGVSLTGLASNPAYNNSGEIPLTLRGGGIETATNGFLTRAPDDLQVDVHADYTIKLNSARQRVVILADVFNLFNRQEPINFDNFSEQSFQTVNPNYGQPVNGGRSSTASFQVPLTVRLGARFEW